ncbi:hypothetical protein E2C01_009522 [Portunus trituberculatus]|uniref:Uncharacterized protein n=1 Tax=Portunus trituberculatus TaxID=210409 RepID=A0A5B7D5Z4_PORTR|nr:hypothetical protein [Portunus trituberculatus]
MLWLRTREELTPPQKEMSDDCGGCDSGGGGGGDSGGSCDYGGDTGGSCDYDGSCDAGETVEEYMDSDGVVKFRTVRRTGKGGKGSSTRTGQMILLTLVVIVAIAVILWAFTSGPFPLAASWKPRAYGVSSAPQTIIGLEDTELVTTTVKFQPRGERLERVGGGRDRDQYRACLQTVADETGQEEDPRDRHCLLPHPANTRVNAALQCYKSHAVVDGDCSAPRGRSSSTSSSESSNTNTSDSISFNSTNSSGSTASTGNSLASSSVHNSDSTNVQTSKRPGKTFFTFSPRNDSRKRRIGTGTNSPAGVALTTTTTTTACLEFSVNGKANIGNNVTKGVKLKTNSLSSNSSYESQTSSNSSNKSFRKFFHRGNVFSNSFKMRNSIKKSAKSSDKSTRKSTTAKATTINNSSSITNSINSNIEENSRFLLPADSVTNIVVVGDKGVGKSALRIHYSVCQANPPPTQPSWSHAAHAKVAGRTANLHSAIIHLPTRASQQLTHPASQSHPFCHIVPASSSWARGRHPVFTQWRRSVATTFSTLVRIVFATRYA